MDNFDYTNERALLIERAEAGILIEGENSTPRTLQKCFALAQSLRGAGYTAELSFTGQEESDYRWAILVCEKGPSPFVVTDCKQKQQQDVASIVEILNILGE